jgi:hypothetical protein
VVGILGLVPAFLMVDLNHLWADRVGAASCLLGSLGVALRPGPTKRLWARPLWAGGFVSLGAYLLVPSGDRPGIVGYALALAFLLALATIQLRRAWD